MWSTASIQSRPTVLLLDASRNVAGWESAFCGRLFTAMGRRGLELVGDGPLTIDGLHQLGEHLKPLQHASCLLLVGPAGEAPSSAAAEMRRYIKWLKANVAGPKLLAACLWQHHDPTLSDDLLKAPDDFAPLAIAQKSPITAREAGLFFLKFFSELHLHSVDQMSARMAWFSWTKANELLKRRGFEGGFAIRA